MIQRVPQPIDPRTSPIVALRKLMPLPPEPDAEANREARMLAEMEKQR